MPIDDPQVIRHRRDHVGFRVPGDIHLHICQIAAVEGETRAAILRRLVRRGLAAEQREKRDESA